MSQKWFIVSPEFGDKGGRTGFRCLTKGVMFLDLKSVQRARDEISDLSVGKEHEYERCLQGKATLLTGKDPKDLLKNLAKEFTRYYPQDWHEVARNWQGLYLLFLPEDISSWPEDPFSRWQGYLISYDFGKMMLFNRQAEVKLSGMK